MALSFATTALLQREIIANLDNKTIIREFANHKFEGELKRQGDTVTVQSLGDVTWNRGQTSGSAITAGTLTVSEFQLTVNECDNVNIPVKDIDVIQYNRDAQGDVASRMGNALAQNMDKYTGQLAAYNATTKNTTAITMAVGNSYSTIARLKTDLAKLNVIDGLTVFVSPEVENFLVQSTEFINTEVGAGQRINGMIGRVAGLDVRSTNNLPHVSTLTMPTIAVDTNTFTIDGVVITFVSSGTAAAAGEVSIGADVAANQVNLVAAINGTGTPGAATYIEFSAADRLILKNAYIQAESAFNASDKLRIYSASAITTSETVTPADFVVSADATIIFAMDRDAVNVVDQMVKMVSRDQQDATSTNLLGEYVYGGAVLGRNADRIATYDVANG